MLIKSVQFNNDFIYNLYDIVFSSKEYANQLDSILSILKGGDSITIGYQQQPFKNVKFVGSYINKKDGDYLTDIDIIQMVNINVNFVKRISQIMKNLDETNFIFARFYCGYVEYLQTPWSFDAQGSCDVDLDKIENWLKTIQHYLPSQIYDKIIKIYEQKSLSVVDLLNIEAIIEPYSTLNWTREELIKTYKLHNGYRYDLLDVLLNYPKKKVFKYLYQYSFDDKTEYCLIDVSIKQYEKPSKIKTSEDFELKAFYQGDKMKLAKYMKKYLPSEIRLQRDIVVKERISKYTPLAGRLELIDKCIKYKLLPETEINNLIIDAKNYATEKDIKTINYDEIQEIIYKNTEDIYNMFRPYILPEYEKLFQIFEIRGEEGNIKISKTILRERNHKGYVCIFFPIDIEDLNNLIQSALNSLLDPKKLIYSVYKSCEELNLDVHEEVKKIFKDVSEHKLKIVEDEKFAFSKKLNLVNENNTILYTSSNVNNLRVFTLFGYKKIPKDFCK